MQSLPEAILLGIVEGLTEFLPVSSTGHLILLIDLLRFDAPEGRVFEIAIQLGAILAICWLFRQKLLAIACGVCHPAGAKRFCGVSNAITPQQVRGDSIRFLRNILLAFLPAMVLGVLFHGFIKEVLFSPYVVCASLIIGGIVIIFVERMHIAPKYAEVEKFPLKLVVAIGFCQALAMIPGTSRSGATIIGALLLKVERKTAAEFSFFLAIPTMFAATVYDLYKNWGSLDSDGLILIAAGFISAFIAAMLVVRWFMRFISTHGFTLFGYYRIALGSLMLILLSS